MPSRQGIKSHPYNTMAKGIEAVGGFYEEAI
jgi:hypothetical protein